MLTKIISGGQTGADLGGLRAGKQLGLATGGCIPRGFPTEDGPKPDLAREFGLREHTSPNYPPRTRANVKDSEGTLRFARNFESRGERCTLKFIEQYGKPSLDIDIDNPPAMEDVRGWLRTNKIKVLNVAGNTEKQAPGIETFVTDYLVKVLSKAQGQASSAMATRPGEGL
jgi:hypothetical protein